MLIIEYIYEKQIANAFITFNQILANILLKTDVIIFSYFSFIKLQEFYLSPPLFYNQINVNCFNDYRQKEKQSITPCVFNRIIKG